MNHTYYVHGRASNDSHPLLAFVDNGPARHSLHTKRFVEPESTPVRLRLGRPEPRSPIMADHLSLPLPVLTRKVAQVIEALQLPDVQLVPAVVETPTREYPYFILNVWNFIACVDRAASDITEDEDDSRYILGIRHLVLDMKAIDEVPPERRLLFRLAESSSTYVFAQPVVDAILGTSPEGIRFWPVNGWGEGHAFRRGA
ncbi:hypothetical protein JQX13_25940 [Archangium violaceum]|uniref:imm11 family protein n=1 Tax=Archangium violaceum TaxID=83451 RepID=UPI00193B20A3|nr:DUF1629 domain-containing protein [Archangium violaceum]QRK13166.1 hypothetical protein JQX13_25940 [Archangium violaceum]